MRKLLIILLSLMLLISLASCGSKENQGSTSAPESTTEAQSEETPEDEEENNMPPEASEEFLDAASDSYLMSMAITPPQDYSTVERYFQFGEAGNLSEKNMIYTMEDGSTLSYAYSKDTELEDILDTTHLKSIEVGAKQYYRYDYMGSYMAFIQMDADLYGINYEPKDSSVDPDAFLEERVNEVVFTGRTTTAIDNEDLFGINYTIDESIPMYSHTLSLTTDPSGNPLKKSLQWRFGEDEAGMLYRFLIRVYKNTTIEDLKEDGKKYEEKNIGDLTFTVEITEEEREPFNYYIENGDDTYLIKNNGATNGWSTSRSDDSIKSFKAFLGTINFQENPQ